jgi:hypothetical protein
MTFINAVRAIAILSTYGFQSVPVHHILTADTTGSFPPAGQNPIQLFADLD